MWRWDQAEPFGNNPADEDPDANSIAFDLPLRLPGQRYDAETGLHYNYFRDYDPSIGRYGESDPTGLSGGLNTYAYVQGNPLLFIDQKGLAREKICPRLGECVNPPVEPTPGGEGIGPGPQPKRQKEDPVKARERCPEIMKQTYGGCDCATIMNSLGTCLQCCSTLAGQMRSGGVGTKCADGCYRREGLTCRPVVDSQG